MAQYPNLPGIEVQIADGGLILPEDAATESMLIIGPSLLADAPKEPVLVRQSSDLEVNGFGGFIEDGQVNPIAAAWKQAFEGGNRRTFLMSIGKLMEDGSISDTIPFKDLTEEEIFLSLQDSLFGMLADFPVDHIVLVGLYADKEVKLTSKPKGREGVIHEYYVEGQVSSFPLTVTVGTNDTIQIDDSTLTLGAKTYQDPAELKVELQKEISETGVKLRVEISNGVVRLAKDTPFTVGAGTNAIGLTEGEAKEKLAGNFALLIGQFAESQTLNHNASIAYIGASAPAGNSLSQVKKHVDNLVSINNQYSGYVSVIAGPELGYVLPGRSELYFTNGVVSYAALVSTLRPESAPTNKRLYGVAGMHYQLSLRQLNALTGNKYVTFRLRNNQIIVTDGCTTAPDYYLGGRLQASDFARLSTLRITQAAAQLVRELTEPFVGEPNRMPQYNALNATIKGGLESMKNSGAIMDYRFTVTARGGTLSEAVVTLELVPAFEMKKVSIDVSLKPPYTM